MKILDTDKTIINYIDEYQNDITEIIYCKPRTFMIELDNKKLLVYHDVTNVKLSNDNVAEIYTKDDSTVLDINRSKVHINTVFAL